MPTTHAVLLLTAAGPVLHSRHARPVRAAVVARRLNRAKRNAVAVIDEGGGRVRVIGGSGLAPLGPAWEAAALAAVRGGLPAALAERVRRGRPRLRLHDAGEG